MQMTRYILVYSLLMTAVVVVTCSLECPHS